MHSSGVAITGSTHPAVELDRFLACFRHLVTRKLDERRTENTMLQNAVRTCEAVFTSIARLTEQLARNQDAISDIEAQVPPHASLE